MKRVLILIAGILVISSCGGGAKLINTATYSIANAPLFVSPVQADLEVSPEKIHYYIQVTDILRAGGEENIVATVVREALDVYDSDVLVGLEKQVKYNESGQIESIAISGYPAKYVNFRPCENIPAIPVSSGSEEKAQRGVLGL